MKNSEKNFHQGLLKIAIVTKLENNQSLDHTFSRIIIVEEELIITEELCCE